MVLSNNATIQICNVAGLTSFSHYYKFDFHYYWLRNTYRRRKQKAQPAIGDDVRIQQQFKIINGQRVTGHYSDWLAYLIITNTYLIKIYRYW